MSEVKVPEMGESIREGTISKWHVKEGDRVNQGDVLAELETDKVNIEISVEESGVVEQLLSKEGETVQVGETIARIGSGEGSALAPAPAAPVAAPPLAPVEAKATSVTVPSPATETTGDSLSSYAASPGARKLARERGIDLGQIQTQDPIGRIRPEDVQAHVAKTAASDSIVSSVQAQPPVSAAPTADPNKPAERRKMSRRRVTIANRLVEAQRTAAMLTTFNEVDMTAILDLRKRRKDAFKEKHEINLGFMSFFTRAVIGALKAFPLLNAEIQGDEIVVKQYYDIGIAVSAKEGLVVPVVRDADRLSFAGIEKQIADLAGKARANTLALSDLQGGTFTITNGGVFGSLLSTPILNAPQVGILGMHKIQLRPVAIDETRMENRPMMYVALSYDHRIVDGSEAVRFLVTLKTLLEDPEALLLEV